MSQLVLSIDVETYGMLRGYNQTVFHPVKMELVDDVPYWDIIKTVSITRKVDGKYENTVFLWNRRDHRKLLVQWLAYCKSVGGILVGHNIVFDLMVLRYCDKEIKRLTDWDCDGPNLMFEDTQIWSFLDFEERPEKSLKSLVELFNITTYRYDSVTGKKGTQSYHVDYGTMKYNAKDTEATYRLREILIGNCAKHHPYKVSDICREHHSALIRVGIEMEENGISIDKSALQGVYKEYEKKIAGYMDEARKCDLKLKGRGSNTSKRTIVERAFEWNDLMDDERVELTKVDKDISLGLDNLRLLLTELPHDHEDRRAIELMQDYTTDSKVVSSYLNPLLNNPLKGGLDVGKNFLCFPKWHLVPSPFGKNDKNESSGTMQGRVTCTNPGFQTWPESIKKKMVSRFRGGYISMADYNRVEIFTGAILSQCPVMIAECTEDVHTKTTLKICDLLGIKVDQDAPTFKGIWRQIGKTINFLVLYRGTGRALRQTLMADAGKFKNYELLKIVDTQMDEELCDELIYDWYQAHPKFGRYQDELIDTAKRNGRIDLPTGWSRCFDGGEIAVRYTYINEICNFPIQCFAAQIVQSCQMEVLKYLKEHNMRTKMCAQTYDSITFDTPKMERDRYEEMIEVTYTHPPILNVLEDKGYETVDFGYEIEYK